MRKLIRNIVYPAAPALSKACPLQAISVPDGISAVVELARCIGCGLCARECPASVIKVVTADV